MLDEQPNWLRFKWPSFHDTEIPINEETPLRLDVFLDEEPSTWLDFLHMILLLSEWKVQCLTWK